MHVTLRNKKNIGLICFMFISSSYFWLLCRTKTAWWSKNENVSNRPKQSKKYVRSDVVTQKIQCKSVFTVHLLILKMFQTDFGCTMNICPNFFYHSGQCQEHKSPMTQLFGIFFGQTLLFSLSTFFLGLPNNANASKEWKFATELVIIGEHIIFSVWSNHLQNKRLQWKNKWTLWLWGSKCKEPKENYWQCHKINKMQICVLTGRRFEETFENTQCRKVKQMQPMQLCIFSCRQFEDAF